MQGWRHDDLDAEHRDGGPSGSASSSGVVHRGAGGVAGGGGGGSAPEPVVDVVSLLTAATVPLALTGEPSTEIVALLSLSDGLVLLNDAVSSSVLLLDAFGAMSLYTADSELMTLSGQASVSLGPLDEVISGTGLGDVYGADSVSGLLFRLGTDGVPTVHATKESILRVTDGTDSRLSLPRFLTNNQIIAQELFGNALLRFGTTPVNPQEFVSADVLATAAGVLCTPKCPPHIEPRGDYCDLDIAACTLCKIGRASCRERV